MHQCGENFFKILNAVSVEDKSLVHNFLMRLSTLQKSCGCVAEKCHSSPRTEAKPRFPYLVNLV